MLFDKLYNKLWEAIEKINAVKLAKQAEFFDNDVIESKDISYDNDNPSNIYNIYFPKSPCGEIPIIVNFHGGGFISGDKVLDRLFCIQLAKQGFCVINANYTLVKEKKFPQSTLDALELLSHLEKKLNSNRFDFNNVFLSGDSSGAHLAAHCACVLTNDKLREEYQPKTNLKISGCIFSSGVFEVFAFGNLPFFSKYQDVILGEDFKEKGLDEKSNIFSLLTEKFPPSLLIGASSDILSFQARKFKKYCTKKKICCKYFEYHGDKELKHVFNVREPLGKIAKQANANIVKFLKEQSKQPSSPEITL